MVLRNCLPIGITIALINYVLFAILWIVIGGSAIHGLAVGGHYFIAEGGRFVQVSRVIFDLSLWQGYGFFITFPIGLGCAWHWSHTSGRRNQIDFNRPNDGSTAVMFKRTTAA